MGSKLIIPVCFFIACQAVYDFFAPVQSTNWSIFYFVSQYFSWLLFVILAPKRQILPYLVLGLGISAYILIQLSKINKPYLAYIESVNNFETIILPVAVMLTGLTFYLLRK
jgi:hypothetical protein